MTSLCKSGATSTPLGHDPWPASLRPAQPGTTMVPRYVLVRVSIALMPRLVRSAKYMVWVEGSKEKTSVLATSALTPVAGAPDVQVGIVISSHSNPANGVAACAGAIRSAVSNAILHRLHNTFLISAVSYLCRESADRNGLGTPAAARRSQRQSLPDLRGPSRRCVTCLLLLYPGVHRSWSACAAVSASTGQRAQGCCERVRTIQ